MAPYSSGVRKLDKIYLDTSWGGMIEGADLVSKVRNMDTRCA